MNRHPAGCRVASAAAVAYLLGGPWSIEAGVDLGGAAWNDGSGIVLVLGSPFRPYTLVELGAAPDPWNPTRTVTVTEYPVEPGAVPAFFDAVFARHPSADLTTTAMPGSIGYGVSDGWVTNDDVFYFLSTIP